MIYANIVIQEADISDISIATVQGLNPAHFNEFLG